MVEAQGSRVARAFWEAVSRPSERVLCRSGAAADRSALLGRESISYGLSLRLRAIIGLSESICAFRKTFALECYHESSSESIHGFFVAE